MIEFYMGEFTVSPIPLEMSMNYCSHNCHYCFANLNVPDRRMDFKKTLNQLQKVQQGSTIEARLLREGYPVLISNRVDPFAQTNYRQTLALLEVFEALAIPLTFQTKGGVGIDETLKMIGSSCWYISISMFNDDIRKQVEPGAPSLNDRFALIEKLFERGHHVSIGLNPMVEEWLPKDDLEKLYNQLKKLGVKDVWIEPLHLNRKQKLSSKAREAMTEWVVQSALNYKDNRLTEYAEYARKLAKESFNVFYLGNPDKSEYWKPYREKYKTFPVLQDLINDLHDETEERGLDVLNITYDYYLNYWDDVSMFDEKFTGIHGLVFSTGRFGKKTRDKEWCYTLKQAIRHFWNAPLHYKEGATIYRAISNHPALKILYRDEKTIELDKDGNIILVFEKE